MIQIQYHCSFFEHDGQETIREHVVEKMFVHDMGTLRAKYLITILQSLLNS